MKIIDLIASLLSKAGTSAAALIALLEKVAAAAPDLAPEAQQAIDALNTAASPQAQADLVAAIVSEALGVVGGKVDGKTHAGDGF